MLGVSLALSVLSFGTRALTKTEVHPSRLSGKLKGHTLSLPPRAGITYSCHLA